MRENTRAALSQAAASLGHAVEVLDEEGVTGPLRDDTALLAERYARVLNQADDQQATTMP